MNILTEIELGIYTNSYFVTYQITYKWCIDIDGEFNENVGSYLGVVVA